MDEKVVQEILHGLLSSLEALDTQSAAVLQLLKSKGIVNEEELASHLEQAGKASNVRWLAVRVRIDYLLSSAIKSAEQDANKEHSQTTENRQEAKAATKQSDGEKTAKDARQVAVDDNPEPGDVKSEADETGASVDKDRSQPGAENGEENNKSGKNVAETTKRAA
jgi:hypothetical protein